MASTALNEEKIKKYFETDAKVNELSCELVNLIKNSKHTVIYTGAGLSTAAGISDSRGKANSTSNIANEQLSGEI
jgi:hypothetical protein